GTAYLLTCYFTNWAQYRPDKGRYTPDNIDPNLCTHLIYAFAGMNNNEITTSVCNDEAMYKTFNAFKSQNRNLKTLLSIGGSKFGTHKFTNMVSNTRSRQTFINSVVKFLRKHGFDGLDLAWLYPGSGASPAQDRALFTILVKELLEAFEQEAKQTNQPRLMVTAAVAGKLPIIQAGYEIAELGKYLDYIQVMTSDFHMAVEGFTGDNSPLHSSNALSIEYAMNYWKNNGAPAQKLLVGFPTYGKTFTLQNPSNHGIGAPVSGPGPAGRYTGNPGLLANYEVCTFLSSGATQDSDGSEDEPYAYKDREWISYDNVTSFGFKVDWLKKNNFGGAMVWALDMDDFTGDSCHQGKYPLIYALKGSLG
ncbi:CHIA chitinase, partial [Hippolais icterina]|nr:CHIA chitinase [Hippolais icterina]